MFQLRGTGTYPAQLPEAPFHETPHSERSEHRGCKTGMVNEDVQLTGHTGEPHHV